MSEIPLALLLLHRARLVVVDHPALSLGIFCQQHLFDNFRKRTERERAEYLQWAGMETVKDLLPVLDDFERAMRVEGGSPEYVKGVEMIHSHYSLEVCLPQMLKLYEA